MSEPTELRDPPESSRRRKPAAKPKGRVTMTDIARAAEKALAHRDAGLLDALRLVVDKGWVTLQGTCESGEQRERVECVVRELMGVVGVSNEIDLEPSARRAREAARDAPMPRRAA